MALMEKRWEEALIRCSELERLSCVAQSQGEFKQAASILQSMVVYIRSIVQAMADLLRVLRERDYNNFIPTIEHYAGQFERFIICAREQLDMLKRTN